VIESTSKILPSGSLSTPFPLSVKALKVIAEFDDVAMMSSSASGGRFDVSGNSLTILILPLLKSEGVI